MKNENDNLALTLASDVIGVHHALGSLQKCFGAIVESAPTDLLEQFRKVLAEMQTAVAKLPTMAQAICSIHTDTVTTHKPVMGLC